MSKFNINNFCEFKESENINRNYISTLIISVLIIATVIVSIVIYNVSMKNAYQNGVNEAIYDISNTDLQSSTNDILW
jgi:uncharacterized protein YpmB